MSCSSSEFETFRSENNTEIRHTVCYFIVPSLGLSVHDYFLFLHPITLFVSGWPLFGRLLIGCPLLLFGCVSEMVSWKYLIGLLWFP